MKKRYFVITIIAMLFLIPSVKAYSIGYNGSVANAYPEIRRYYTNIDGVSAMVYCLDPGRQFLGAGRSYSVYRVVEPSQSTGQLFKFDVAATYAYQKMLELGYTSTSDAHRVIGTTAFRLIQRRYTDRGTVGIAPLNTAWAAYGGSVLRSNNANIRAGISIYTEAVAVAESGKTYEQLVEAGYGNGGIWGPQYDFQITSSSAEGDNVSYTYRITPKGTAAEHFTDYASGVTVTCANPSVQCSINTGATTTDATSINVQVVINKASWDQQDMGVILNVPYCDAKASAFHLVILKNNGKSAAQHMIAVLPSSCSALSSRTPHSSHRVPTEPVDSCTCDTNTGTFIFTSKTGDKQTCNPKTGNCSSFITSHSCPGTCERTRSCEKDGNTYYCKNGNTCSQETFASECLKPQCSKEGETYYCNDKDGDGGGDKCTQKEYEKDCECPKLETDCDGGNKEACDEYNTKCVNCSPIVSIPSDCNNLDVESTKYGTISDILKEKKDKTSCQSDEEINAIKACVINKKDAAENEYDATSYELGTSSNPYCKIYCAEDYDFQLPTAKHSKSGSYFTLSLKISGKRDCYTASAMDPTQPIGYNKDGQNQFLIDLENAQHEVIDAYNDYSYWYYAANHSTEVHHTDTHSSSSSSDCGCESSCSGNDPGCSSSPPCPCSGDSTTDDYYTYTWQWKRERYDGTDSMVSASYQDGTEGYCPSSCCSGSCRDGERGTSQYSYFRTQEKNYLSELQEKINKLNSLISQFNSCSGVITNENRSNVNNTKDPSSTSSTSWDNKMVFEPKIDFTYHEDYLYNIEGGFEAEGSTTPKGSYMYCSGDTSLNYECSSGKSTSIQTYDQNYVICGKEETGCFVTSSKISTAKWVQKTKSVTTTYKSKTNFSTYTPYGTVISGSGKDNILWTNLPDDALPVSLVTETGVFPFKFTFSNIGQSNQNGSLGRLIGNSKSILTAYNALPADETCKNEKYSSTVDGGYVCHYLNNCDDCDFYCQANKCGFRDDEGDKCDGECDFYCDTCLFDGDRMTYTYRTVSLNNLFPNARNEHQGWNWTGNEKGKATLKEIESNDTDPEEVYKTPQYSYTLTPANLQHIREYNDEAGTYTNAKIPDNLATKVDSENDALYCENVNIGGINYKLKCKSRFLDLIERSGNEYATDVKRNEEWTLYNGEFGTRSGIGPAWK